MNYVYVDDSNVWIEGMRLSAVRGGMAPDIASAQRERIRDQGWALDLVRLYEFVAGEPSGVGRAVLFGSGAATNAPLWAVARRSGFEPIILERDPRNREKKVDTSLATEILADSFTRIDPDHDEVTLVAGDGDYVPVVASLTARRIRTIVMFWAHASRELREAATRFVALDPFLGFLSLD